MKYQIYTNNQNGFAQFVSLPEKGDVHASVFSAQQRMSTLALDKMQQLVMRSSAEYKEAQTDYHDDPECKEKIDSGFVLSGNSYGTLITVINRRGEITVVVNTTVVVQNVSDSEGLVKAITEAIV